MGLKPKVDVIIPCHGHVGYVLRCVELMRSQPRLGKIVLIDDGSLKEENEAFNHIETVTVYRNEISQGFVASCKRGVKKTDSKYFLLLNSDAFAGGKVLEYMASNLDEGFAVCGARLTFCAGSRYGIAGYTQHAGVGFNINGLPYHPYMNLPGNEPCVMKWRSINAVTGAAMMIHRDVWERLGGFDNRFGRGVYEDVDFSLMTKKAGHEIAYEPLAHFDHLMHGSQPETGGFFEQHLHDQNLAYLYTKHGPIKCDDDLYYKSK